MARGRVQNRARPSGPALTTPLPRRRGSGRAAAGAAPARRGPSARVLRSEQQGHHPGQHSPPTAIAAGTSFEEPPMPPTATARWRPATRPARGGGAGGAPSSTRTVTPGGRSAAAARGTPAPKPWRSRNRAGRRPLRGGREPRAGAVHGGHHHGVMPPLALIGADSRVSWPSRAAADTAAASACRGDRRPLAARQRDGRRALDRPPSMRPPAGRAAGRTSRREALEVGGGHARL